MMHKFIPIWIALIMFMSSGAYSEPSFIGYIFQEKMKDGHFVIRNKHSNEKDVEGDFRDGKKEGVWTFYRHGTQKIQEGLYRNDLREGTWTLWYGNGQINYQGRCFRDKATGPWVTFGPKGGKREEGSYKAGVKTGLWHTWYDNGQMLSEGIYENGVPEGLWTYWHPNGRIMSKVNRTVSSELQEPDREKEPEFRTEDGKLIEYKSWLPKDIDIFDIQGISVKRKQNCKFITVLTSDYTRREFIRRPSDKKPILYYQHGRIIEPTLGHQNRLVLINDFMASKGNQVMISDLQKAEPYRIDKKALEHYEKRFPENGGFIIPVADAISPDDKQVLIHMELINQSPGPVQTKWYRNHPNRFYVVSSVSGKILKIDKKKKIPPKWWVSNAKQKLP